MNREAWLTELAKRMEASAFRGYRFGTERPYRITMGWPSSRALSNRRRVIGECHGLKTCTSGAYEIFISPTLEKPLEVAGVVCHEMAHVIAGIEAAHGKKFVKLCKEVGLVKGTPTTIMPGPKLDEKINKAMDGLGEYPHKSIKVLAPLNKVKSYIVKCVCTKCECVVVISKKWLEEAGTPCCGCGSRMKYEVEEGDV